MEKRNLHKTLVLHKMRKGLVTTNATLSSLIILKGGVNNEDLLLKYTSSPIFTLVNVDLLVFTRIAGTS